MSIGIIQINDVEVRVGTGKKINVHSPGCAIIENDGVVLGEEALRRAHLNPRHTNDRFWSNLSQDALQTPSKRFRHNADLAYAHLLHLYDQSGKPDEVIFAVPSSFNSEQLALLLGIAQACPFTPVGLVDSAVAAAAAVAGPGRYAVVELHLHHFTITHLDVDTEVARVAADTVDGTGLTKIHEDCAELIGDVFIQQSRFDPHHHAQTEQALYDQLPTCLKSLAGSSEILLEIQFENTRHQAKLRSEALQQILARHFREVQGQIPADRTVLLGDHAAQLPDLGDTLGTRHQIPAQAVFSACHGHHLRIRSRGPALSFVTRLPASPQPTVQPRPATAGTSEAPTAVNHGQTPTHLLAGHIAYRIDQGPLYISASAEISQAPLAATVCKITGVGQSVMLVPADSAVIHVNGRSISADHALTTGDQLSVAGEKPGFTLIHESPPDAA